MRSRTVVVTVPFDGSKYYGFICDCFTVLSIEYILKISVLIFLIFKKLNSRTLSIFRQTIFNVSFVFGYTILNNRFY